MIDNDSAKELKKDFPLLRKNVIYLDNAATSQKPREVIDALNTYYEETNANIHRGVYPLSAQSTQLYDDARKEIAKLINASFEEVIFTGGTTESLNLLSFTLFPLFKERKEIVLTEMEHHANIVPWQQMAKRHGLVLKFIKMKDDFTLDYDDAKEKITENTALVSFAHISNALGTVHNIAALVALAKDKGALTVVDAAQSVPQIPVDVKAIGCDFLAFSGHKMLGPTGIGVLYGRKELLEEMEPFNTGGDMIKTVSLQESTWNKLPEKFEAGTPHIAGAIGLMAASKYLRKIGLDKIHVHEQELLKYGLEQLGKVPGIKIYNAGVGKSAGIISFTLEGVHPHDIASLVAGQGVCLRAGHHCCMPLMERLGITGTSRISFGLYNTTEDIDILIHSLSTVLEVFAKNG